MTSFKCPICGICFADTESLYKHYYWVHAERKTHFCKFCNKPCFNEACLRIHEWTHTKDKPFLCEHCRKGFSTKSGSVVHMRICKASNRNVANIIQPIEPPANISTPPATSMIHTVSQQSFSCGQIPSSIDQLTNNMLISEEPANSQFNSDQIHYFNIKEEDIEWTYLIFSHLWWQGRNVCWWREYLQMMQHFLTWLVWTNTCIVCSLLAI